jgi:aminopeptidase N
MRPRLFLRVPLVLIALWTGPCAAEPPPVPLGPLPDTVRPEAYRLELTVDPSQGAFSGHTEIDVSLTRPASSLFLHGRDLRVSRARVSAAGEDIPAQYTQLDVTGVARLDLPRQLPAGKVTLCFDYTADFRNSSQGLFHAWAVDAWYAWTQMEPIDARRMFPGFDEPGFKTPFTVVVKAPVGARVLANAPEVSAEAAGTGMVHRFAPTRPLPTYLVAIAVGPFDAVETSVPPDDQRAQPLPFRVIAARGQKPRMQIAATEGPKLLAALEAYVGLPYPFEKLDLAASPVQSGAMENAGFILFQDSLLLLDAEAPSGQLRSFGVTTAHEMSHQWFGDLVTPAWWTDIWLSESFAEWLGNKIAAQWRPDLDVPVLQLARAREAMDIDARGLSRQIHQQITDSRQIGSAFDAITYHKGAQVLSMFESFLGPVKFREGARRHLQRRPYGSATAEDFFRALGEAAGDPRVAAALRTFTDQPGVPVISVSESPRGVTLTQSPYHPLGVQGGAQLWTVPVCLSRAGARTCTLLESAMASLPPVPGEGPLLPNAGGAGYYRFHLDDAGWDRLIAVSGNLPPLEAMAVGDSLWSDFAAGSGSFERVIAGARALAAVPQAQVATELAGPLAQLYRTLLGPADMTGYRQLMKQIYGPPLAALGVDLRRGAYGRESPAQRALRQSLVSVVALSGQDPALRGQLAVAAAASLGGDPAVLDDAFRRVAFMVAVQEQGQPFRALLLEVLQKSKDPQLRQDAVVALGAADTPQAATATLEQAFYAAWVHPEEALALLAGLAYGPGSRSTARTFVSDHFDAVAGALPAYARPALLGMLFGQGCSEEDMAQADAWAQLHVGSGGELTRTKERIGLCASLRKVKGAEISALLRAAAL